MRPKALQLFYLKSLIQGEVQKWESKRDFSIIPQRDKDPSHTIIRLSSEFELNKNLKKIDNFIKESPPEVLENYHFFTPNALDLYREGKVDEFLEERKSYLKNQERKFVESLGINYADS